MIKNKRGRGIGQKNTCEGIAEENHTSFNLAFLLNTLCSADTLLSDFEGD